MIARPPRALSHVALALVAVAGLASACSEAIVGDAVFFCAADAPCGAGQACTSCPPQTLHAGRSVCLPPGGALASRCGAGPDADADAGGDADADVAADVETDVVVLPSGPPIVVNRAEGPAPLGVIFAVDAVDPDVAYAWDFGDPGGTWARTGFARGSEPSPVAAHLYAEPGVYTARLTVTDAAGAVSETRQTITVTAAPGGKSDTVCFANAAGGDPCPDGAASLVGSSLGALIAQAGPATRRILLRRGDSFAAGATSTLPVAAGLIAAYGGASDPPAIAFADTDALALDGGDWRVLGVAFSGGSASAVGVRAVAGALTFVDVTHAGPGALASGAAEVVLVDTDVASGGLAIGSGAVLGGRVLGGLRFAGGPLLVAHGVVSRGILGGDAPCAGLAAVIDSAVTNQGAPAIDGAGCGVEWHVARTFMLGAGGLTAPSASRVVARAAIVYLEAPGDGLVLSGLDSRAIHDTCYNDFGGGTCVRVTSGARRARVADVLMASVGGVAVSDGGNDTNRCAGCDLVIAPVVAFDAQVPSFPQDFIPAPGSGAVDVGTPVEPWRMDFGRRCRPSGGGWDVGAWERGAALCP